MSSLEFIDKSDPEIRKPLVIAAMQDMGNVGSIVVNFINKSLGTTPFRHVKSTRPPYVYDRGGFIEIPEEKWEYRFGNDFIIFGGGPGQPQQTDELNELCQDVIDIAKKYDAKFIYTVGGFHTSKQFGKHPTTYVTTTSKSLLDQVQRLGIESTPRSSQDLMDLAWDTRSLMELMEWDCMENSWNQIFHNIEQQKALFKLWKN